jgi:glucuronate isomerase
MKYFENLLHSIKELPIFDVHSHISIDQPQCRDLSDILFYHFMRRELYSAGLKDDNYLVSNTPFEERIGEFFKYKPLVENTTTFWCIKKILNDIYHVTDGDIRPDNWKDLQQQIIQKGRDFSYPKSILNRMNAQCSLICENQRQFLKKKPF